MDVTSHIKKLFGVDGKVVLVTGGTRGIGRAMAQGFVEAGSRVYISSRNMADAEKAAQELSEFGVCHGLQADINTVEGCAALASDLASREATLDVLINNAGSTWHDDVAHFPETAWDEVMQVNVKAPFFLTQALLPLLSDGATLHDPARVINVGSIRGYMVPRRPSFAYSASKGALHQLSRHMAVELAPSAITVNVLAPGVYESRMSGTSGSANRTPIPLGRPADALDISAAAIYLASRAGSYLTGVTIPVDGGVGVVPT